VHPVGELVGNGKTGLPHAKMLARFSEILTQSRAIAFFAKDWGISVKCLNKALANPPSRCFYRPQILLLARSAMRCLSNPG